MDKDRFMIYPLYFDATKTYSQGRKCPLKVCVSKPTCPEIQSALKFLDLPHTFESEKRHPRDPFTYGRFSIERKYGRKHVIEGILGVIKESRNVKVEIKPEVKPVVEEHKAADPANPLGFVARKKKKVAKK